MRKEYYEGQEDYVTNCEILKERKYMTPRRFRQNQVGEWVEVGKETAPKEFLKPNPNYVEENPSAGTLRTSPALKKS